MLIVYTGNGKGKTTASLGIALRAVGAGKTVEVFKFMKGRESSEDSVLRKLGVPVHLLGRKEFVNLKNPDSVDIELAKKGLELLENSKAEIVIADELNVATGYGLMPVDAAISVLRKFNDRVIVSTGRSAPKEFIEMADIVTEMKEIKHHFNEGKPAMKGVDF